MPLGVKCTKDYIYARIFKGSRFYHVLKESMRIFIYPTYNAEMFYKSLKKNLQTIYSIKHQCYMIPGIPTHIEGRIEKVNKYDNYKIIKVTPLDKAEAFKLLNNGYTRADGCLIELMVYHTKLQSNVISMKEYCGIFDICSKSIRRSTSNKLFLKILDELKC